MRGRDASLELLPEPELFVLGQHRKVFNTAETLILSLYHIVDSGVGVTLFPAFFAVELGGCPTNSKHTAFHKGRCDQQLATCMCCLLAWFEKTKGEQFLIAVIPRADDYLIQ